MKKLRKSVVIIGMISIYALCLSSCGKNNTNLKETQLEEIQLETQLLGEVEQTEDSEQIDLHEYDFTICFGGDISLDERAVTTKRLDSSENGIYDCISPELISTMHVFI